MRAAKQFGLAVAVGVLIAGCAGLQQSSGRPQAISSGQHPERNEGAMSQSAKTLTVSTLPPVHCQTGIDTQGRTLRCEIDLVATYDESTDKCSADAPDVLLQGTKKVVLVWRTPNRFHFCPVLGDGIFLKHAVDVVDDQFDELFSGPNAGDPSDSASHKGCHRRFRVRAENTKNPPEGTEFEYAYLATFRHRSGAHCKVDPWIKNGR